MNRKRAIGGFLLSFVFLAFFVYIISDIRFVLDNFSKNIGRSTFIANVSDSIQGIATQNTDENTVASVVQPDIQPSENISDVAVPVPVPATVPVPAPAVNSMPKVDAESAISLESNLYGADKIIFNENSNMQLPIASLTKLMTAIIVLDNYNLSDTVAVDGIADSQDQIKNDVELGDTMSVENFLYIMLISSSNKSAYALAEGPNNHPGEPAFVNMMNQKAKILGLESTFFADPTGLSPQNISTAGDLAKLAEYILRNYPKIAEISKLKQFYIPSFGEITNTDQLLGEFPEIVCSKTGFTGPAKGCLLLVINNPKNNDYLINVILGADDRFSEMKKIIDWQSTACIAGN